MKYLIQTKEMGLKIAPTFDKNKLHRWRLKALSDSAWASNKKDRKSINGFVIMLEETPIMWRYQAQKSVALSSTEVALVKGLRCCMQYVKIL
jgi:hypothetical protein